VSEPDDSDNPVKAAMARAKRVTPDLKVVGGRAVEAVTKPKRTRKPKAAAPQPEPEAPPAVEDSAAGDEAPLTDDFAPPEGLTPDDVEKAKVCKDLDPNDRDNGRRLIIWFGQDLLYVSGMGWLTWRGTHWQRDEGDLGARAKAQALVDKIKLEAAFLKATEFQQRVLDRAQDAMKKPEDERSDADRLTIKKSLLIIEAVAKKKSDRVRFAIGSGNSGKTEAMLKQAASHQAMAAEDLDKDLHRFNLRSGTLRFWRYENPDSDPDSPTYGWRVEHRPHDRADRITKCAEVDYDPEATCPLFLAFLERVQPDVAMRVFTQIVHGYALLLGGNDEQILVYHYGTGANGKSAFLETVGRMAGSYRAVVSPDTLVGDGARDGSKANSDIARLHSARFVTVEELPRNTPLRDNLIKSLTGGTRQVARFLQKENFEFDPVFTAVMTGNDMPNLSAVDYGIKRRVRIVPWEVTIPPEDRMPFGELMKRFDAERAGILNWLIAGALRYLNEGLAVPEKVTALTDEYWEERDNVSVFAKSCLVPQPGMKLRAGDAYKGYQTWCEKNGLRPASQRSFGDRLNTLGFKKERGNYYYYLDVTLEIGTAASVATPPPDDPDDPGWGG